MIAGFEIEQMRDKRGNGINRATIAFSPILGGGSIVILNNDMVAVT